MIKTLPQCSMEKMLVTFNLSGKVKDRKDDLKEGKCIKF